MKKSTTFFMLFSVILTGSLLVTCQKDGNEPITTESEVAFAINISYSQNASTMKRAMAYDLLDADRIILTIQNSDGSATKYTSSEVKIQQMNGSYYTQKMVLKTGNYKLTEFLILNSNDSTIFAAPLVGSQEAQNVSSPLPIAFTVTKNATTPVNVEVLSTENKKPEDFGLNSFPIIEVKTFGFMIGVTDKESDKLLSAKLTVSHASYSYVQNLDSILNNVVTVKDSLSNYTLTVEKTEYITYTHIYPIDSLKMFKNETWNLPLLIELEKNAIPTNGLIAYYPFNGNANDESGNGNNGINNGATLAEDRFGNSNSAYSFDGVDDHIVGSATNLPTDERTVSLWFNANNLDSYPVLFGYGGNNCGTSWLMFILNPEVPGNYQFQSHCHVNLLNGLYDNEPINRWIHYTVSTNSSGTRMYINGKEISSNSTFVNNTFVANKEYYIGTCVNPSGIGGMHCYYLNGKVDDIRIYNRALSEQEIQALYNEGK
ncbi:MAG: LamG domain-containing protein [Bacteroidales bacterium]|nr:LamG domain-containing protein [Bacteroidales bacterium]